MNKFSAQLETLQSKISIRKFSVLCWNPHGEGKADIRKIAYKNELKDKPDLVFLQEVFVSQENAETHHINKDIYGTEWGSCKSHNVILYKNEKFLCIWSEDAEKKVEQAIKNIASKIRCANLISMAIETGQITVQSEKEAVTRKVTEMLKESKLEPLPELTADIGNVWEDDDLKFDQNRITYLAGCIEGADIIENSQIKTLLDKHATMALLQARDSPEEKILAVCYHGPRHSPDNERALHLLLQVIKELCKLLGGCPVLLAGDFTMELWNEEGWLNDYLLSDYNPHPYAPTKRREKAKCIDHILLWNGGQRDYTCSLENVKPKMIDITEDMRPVDEDQDESTTSNALISWPTKPDDQQDWVNNPDGEKPAKLAKMQWCLAKKVAEEEIRKKISLHDPLRATLQLTRRGVTKKENI